MSDRFFDASKLFWMLVRPESLIFVLLAISFMALCRERIRLARRALGNALIGMLLIGILPLGDLLIAPLEARYPANPKVTDVRTIIVLGGAENIASSVRWKQPIVNDSADRYFAGILLARRFPDANVLIDDRSGNLKGSGLPGGVAFQTFRNSGIAADRLRIDAVSRNTAENAVQLRKLGGNSLAGNAVLVTSAFHMPRAMATFCAAGWNNLTPWPTDYVTGSFRDDIGWNLAGNLASLNLGMKEWIGLIAYRLTGRTRDLLGANCRQAPAGKPDADPNPGKTPGADHVTQPKIP